MRARSFIKLVSKVSRRARQSLIASCCEAVDVSFAWLEAAELLLLTLSLLFDKLLPLLFAVGWPLSETPSPLRFKVVPTASARSGEEELEWYSIGEHDCGEVLNSRDVVGDWA
jgi:hypothetical protein